MRTLIYHSYIPTVRCCCPYIIFFSIYVAIGWLQSKQQRQQQQSADFDSYTHDMKKEKNYVGSPCVCQASLFEE